MEIIIVCLKFLSCVHKSIIYYLLCFPESLCARILSSPPRTYKSLQISKHYKKRRDTLNTWKIYNRQNGKSILQPIWCESTNQHDRKRTAYTQNQDDYTQMASATKFSQIINCVQFALFNLIQTASNSMQKFLYIYT